VRDENSRQLVEHALGRDAAMVLDPCLQFPETVTGRFSTGVGDYALVYGTLFPDWLSQKVRRWADRTGVRLVSIGYSNGWAHEQRIGCGPIEFARTVAGARSVITNYFHGCVFALMFGKPWIAIASDYRAIKIPDLAALLGVEHRLVDEQTPTADLADLLGTSAGSNVASNLVEHRSRSEAYLNAALS
jgi:Polysaccharide pyruvyl transferase